MAADTTLSITQIELGLAQYFNFRNNVIVPNVSWGLLNHEADLLILNKSGYLTEIEIKRTPSQYEKDLAQYVNKPQIFKTCSFADFMPRKGFKCEAYLHNLR